VDGPSWTTEVTYGIEGTHPLQSQDLRFVIDLNYAEPRQRKYFFVATGVDEGLEGPPSDVSDLVIVNPGELIKLDLVAGVANDSMNLYRSDPGAADFMLVETGATNPWTEDLSGIQNVVLPPYGNYNESSGASDVDDFLFGSVIHPAGFAAAFHYKGSKAQQSILWLSDFYRWHAWPEEYTLEFTNPIIAIARSGGSILVFTNVDQAGGSNGGEVFAISGSNPAHMNKIMLSDTAPMLRYHGGVEIVTRNHFTRTEWSNWFGDNLSNVQIKTDVADNSIFIWISATETPGSSAQNLRIDIEENDIMVSHWTDRDGGESLEWTSKEFEFDRQKIFDCVRVIGDGTTTLTFTIDDSLKSSETGISDTKIHELSNGARVHGYKYKLKISATGTVHSVVLYERQVFTVEGQSITLTPEQVEAWESFYCRFPNNDKFVAGYLTVAKTGTFKIDIRKFSDLSLVFSTALTSVGAEGRYFFLSRSLSNLDICRVSISDDSSSGGPYTPIPVEQLKLYTRKTQRIEGNAIHIVRSEGEIPPWLYTRYEAPDRARIASVIVKASSGTPTMQFYYEAASAADQTQSISNGNEIRLVGDSFSCMEFDFNSADYTIREVMIFLTEVEAIEAPGLIIRDGQRIKNWRRRFLEFKETGSFRGGRVVASDYTSMTLTLRAGGNSYAETISSNDDFLFADNLVNDREWELDLAHQGEIYELHLYGRVRHHLKNGRVIIWRGKLEPFSWLGHLLLAERPVDFSAARIIADSYPLSLKLLTQDAERVNVQVNDDNPFRLPGVRPERLWRLDVTGAETDLIHEVGVACSMSALK
jgi:hypothetical protein